MSRSLIPLVRSSADQYTYYSYDLMVVGSTATKTYSVADLEGMAAVTGYGEFLNTFPRFVDQGELTGVSVLGLLGGAGGLPSGDSVRITASDGYVITFTYDQVENNHFTMYNPNSDPTNPTDYHFHRQPTTSVHHCLRAERWPHRAVVVRCGLPSLVRWPRQQATDSVNWVKYVTKLEVIPSSKV